MVSQKIYVDPGPSQLAELLELLGHITEGSIDGRTIRNSFCEMSLFENSETDFLRGLPSRNKQQFYPFYLTVTRRFDVAPPVYQSRIQAFVETLHEVGIQATAESVDAE